MGLSDQSLSAFRNLSAEELKAWDEAFIAVECYLGALRLRNRLVTVHIVGAVLSRAFERYRQNPDRLPRVMAIEETLQEISRWTQAVLNELLEENRLAARGRLALLLADMPGKWQKYFLIPPPLPEEFTEKMRRSYLAAGPRFAELTMLPQPLELNAFGTGAAKVWETVERVPTLRRMAVGIFLITLVAGIWFVIFS